MVSEAMMQRAHVLYYDACKPLPAVAADIIAEGYVDDTDVVMRVKDRLRNEFRRRQWKLRTHSEAQALERDAKIGAARPARVAVEDEALAA